MFGSTIQGGGAAQELPHPVQGRGVAFPPLPILLSVEFGSISKPTESAVRFQQLGEKLSQLMHKIHAGHINQIQAFLTGGMCYISWSAKALLFCSGKLLFLAQLQPLGTSIYEGTFKQVSETQ